MVEAMDVLIVEPDRDLAKAYSESIKTKGLAVSWVTNGQDAIVALDRHKAKLICLEVHLTGHNGVEFLHELRSYPEWDDVKVLLVTYVPEADLGLSDQQKRQLGIAGYFYKPRINVLQLASFIGQEVR